MKLLKYLTIAFGSIFALLLIVAAVLAITTDEQDVKTLLSKQVEESYDRKLEINGDLDFDVLTLQPQIVVHDIMFSNPDWANEPQMVQIEKFLIHFELWPLLIGDLRILNTEVKNGVVHLIKQHDRTNWDALTAQEDEPEKESYFSLDQVKNITVEHFKITYNNASSPERQQLMIASLTAEDLFSPQRQAKLEGSLNEMDLGFSLDQRQVEAAGADRLFELTAHLGQVSAFFTGDISDEFDDIQGRVRIMGPGETLTSIAKSAGLNVAQLQPFDGFGTLNADLQNMRFELTELDADYGQSQAKGTLAANLGGAVPSIEADLVFPQLANADLKSLTKTKVTEVLKEEITDVDPKAQERQAEKKKLFDDDPLGTLIPAGLQVSLQAEIEKYSADDWTKVIEGGRGQISLKEQQLVLSPVIIQMLGGALAIEGDVSQNQQALAADLEVKGSNIELKRVAEGLANLDEKLNVDEIVGGAFDAVVDVRFSGESPQRMASTLEGNLGFAVRDGYVGSLFVEALEFDVTEAFTSWLMDNPKTDVKCMIAKFDITAGKFDSKSVLVNTADSNVLGKGTIDLAAETVDFGVIARAKDYSITGNPVTFVAKGDILNPRLDIGGENSLLEEVGEALVAPLVNTYQEVFGDDDPNLRGCKRFESEIAQIQQKARVSMAE